VRVGIVYDCIFPFDTGGGERVYRAMADRMLASGHDVTYVTRSHDSAYPGVGFRIAEVSQGPLYDSAGARTTGGALRFAWGVFKYLAVRRDDFDLLVVSALPVLTLIAARAATLGTRTTLVADWLEVWPWRKWREYSGAAVGTIATVLQWIGARATPFNTVNSGFTAQRLRAVRRSSAPLVLGLFDLTPTEVRVTGRSEPPVALFVGRWIADKRVDLLPAAIRRAREKVPALECVIVGSGTEEGVIDEQIRAVGGEAYIRLRGRVDDATLDELMSQAAVLVNPSAREGFGLVVTESAARGVPVVVVSGEDNASVELVAPGINGFVARDASPAVLGDAIADAVLGGTDLRTSTAAWYAEMTAANSFDRSVADLISLAESRNPSPS